MPFIIYMPSSTFKVPAPLSQGRSFPGAICSTIYRNPLAVTAICAGIYIYVYHQPEMSVAMQQLRALLDRALGSLSRSAGLETKRSFGAPSASTQAATMATPKTLDPTSIEGLQEELKANPFDPNSFARPDKAKVSHMELDLAVDFDKHILSGVVIFTVDRVSPSANKLLLDTVDLIILNVSLIGETNTKLNYILHKAVPEFGSKLEIDVIGIKGEKFKVQVDYQTAATARALQWLTPEQTDGGVYPFLFSQCEAINARSMVPCQDTPAVKATYSAKIEAPVHATVLMSAQIAKQSTKAPSNDQHRVHHFNQPVPIPSYLIAIAAGDLVSKQLGPRSQVWSERGLIDKAAWEFEQVEHILKTAESIAGPYLFKVYDLLILPPSFPFGGMENPCLTFVTPTLLAGDRSLVNVVAHEIAHSWTGNLVTSANFEHFWLNEGFTTFLERKIVGKIGQGEQTRHFAALEGLKGLKSTLNVMGATNPLTQLVTDLKGINPDDAFSVVPYEKGHTLLFYLETLLGGPSIFEPFLRAYIEQFKLKSITTNDFKKFLIEYFFMNGTSEQSIKLTEVNWNGWLKTPGPPLVTPQYDTTLLNVSVELAKKWIELQDEQLKDDSCPFKLEEFKALSSGQKKLFLIELDEQTEKKRLSPTKLERMATLYKLNEECNAEVATVWILLGLKSQWQPAVKEATKFVTAIGRTKFIRPIYRALYQWSETKQLALDTFKANKDRMMALSVTAIAAELQLK